MGVDSANSYWNRFWSGFGSCLGYLSIFGGILQGARMARRHHKEKLTQAERHHEELKQRLSGNEKPE